MEASRLSLTDYLTPLVFADKLTVFVKPNLTYSEYKKTISKALKLSEKLNPNSSDEFRLLDNFRYGIFRKVNDYLTNGDKKKAKELMKLLDKYADEKKYPYQDENGKKYADYLRQRI